MLGVSLRRLMGVVLGMHMMGMSQVRVMGCLLMAASLIMAGRLFVMTGSLSMMLCGVTVMMMHVGHGDFPSNEVMRFWFG